MTDGVAERVLPVHDGVLVVQQAERGAREGEGVGELGEGGEHAAHRAGVADGGADLDARGRALAEFVHVGVARDEVEREGGLVVGRRQHVHDLGLYGAEGAEALRTEEEPRVRVADPEGGRRDEGLAGVEPRAGGVRSLRRAPPHLLELGGEGRRDRAVLHPDHVLEVLVGAGVGRVPRAGHGPHAGRVRALVVDDDELVVVEAGGPVVGPEAVGDEGDASGAEGLWRGRRARRVVHDDADAHAAVAGGDERAGDLAADGPAEAVERHVDRDRGGLDATDQQRPEVALGRWRRRRERVIDALVERDLDGVRRPRRGGRDDGVAAEARRVGVGRRAEVEGVHRRGVEIGQRHLVRGRPRLVSTCGRSRQRRTRSGPRSGRDGRSSSAG